MPWQRSGQGKKKKRGGGDLSGVAENLGSVAANRRASVCLTLGPSLPPSSAIRGQDEKLPSSPLLVLVCLLILELGIPIHLDRLPQYPTFLELYLLFSRQSGH